MFTLLKTVFGSGLSSILSPLKIGLFIVLFAAIAGVSYLVYDTYKSYGDMKTKIAEMTVVNSKLTEQLEEKSKEINKLKESNQATVTVVSDNFKEHSKADASLNKSTTKRDKKVEEIKDDFSKLPPTPENKQEEVKQISTANIDSVWETFCAATTLSEDVTECQQKTDNTDNSVIKQIDKTETPLSIPESTPTN